MTAPERDAVFKRVIGLPLLVFGGWVFHGATGTVSFVAGGAVMLAALVLMLPGPMQQVLQMIVGFGRSAGVIKTKHHSDRSGSRVSLAETISAPMPAQPPPAHKPQKRPSQDK